MRHFTDPRRQADYEMALANHRKCMSAANETFRNYQFGYEYPSVHELRPRRSTPLYPFWAAGVDNHRRHARRARR